MCATLNSDLEKGKNIKMRIKIIRLIVKLQAEAKVHVEIDWKECNIYKCQISKVVDIVRVSLGHSAIWKMHVKSAERELILVGLGGHPNKFCFETYSILTHS